MEVEHKVAVQIALSMYLGEHCKYCGKKYTTLQDLHDTVYAGYHERGRLACQVCWDINNPVKEAK